MDANLITQGMNLLIFGMGTVFVFLTLLVLATSTMSRLVKQFETIEDESAPERSSQVSSAPLTISTTHRRAIEAAIKRYRADHS